MKTSSSSPSPSERSGGGEVGEVGEVVEEEEEGRKEDRESSEEGELGRCWPRRSFALSPLCDGGRAFPGGGGALRGAAGALLNGLLGCSCASPLPLLLRGGPFNLGSNCTFADLGGAVLAGATLPGFGKDSFLPWRTYCSCS